MGRTVSKPDTYKWAICLKTSPDQVIGDISVVSQDQESQSCELGYILGKKFWEGVHDRSRHSCFGFLIERSRI